ncbi:hypothetical protein ACWG5P_25450 [Streptomyces prasinus]
MRHPAHSNGTDRSKQGRGGFRASPTTSAERPGEDVGAFLHRVPGGSARFVARQGDMGEETGGEI